MVHFGNSVYVVSITLLLLQGVEVVLSTQENDNMELKRIHERAKEMQMTMKQEEIVNEVLTNMLKEVLSCKDEAKGQNYWAAIRGYVKVLPESEKLASSRSSIPLDIQATIKNLSQEVYDASITFYNTGNISRVLRRHGKSGGGLFNTDHEYATMMQKMTNTKLRAEYSAKPQEWDGTIEGLPTPTPPATEETATPEEGEAQ